jgi:hypothetical protein
LDGIDLIRCRTSISRQIQLQQKVTALNDRHTDRAVNKVMSITNLATTSSLSSPNRAVWSAVVRLLPFSCPEERFTWDLVPSVLFAASFLRYFLRELSVSHGAEVSHGFYFRFSFFLAIFCFVYCSLQEVVFQGVISACVPICRPLLHLLGPWFPWIFLLG